MLPKEKKYFVTGNATFETGLPCLVVIPHSQDEWLYLTFFGALAYMSDPASWMTGGETTPEEAAAIFEDVYNKAHTMLFLIGMISDFGGPLPDDSGWLQCDGTAYLQSDYPELFAAVGTRYNVGSVPSDKFCVPDLIGRVRATVDVDSLRLPSWANTAGGSAGEPSHTLTTAEMPSHTHTDVGHSHVESGATPTAITIGAGVPAPSALPSPSVTGSGNASITNTGGDGAHNNIQPTMVLYTYILAKF